MANNGESKILVCCGVNGRIISFADRLNQILTNKPFDIVFCIGDFFGDEDSCENEWKTFLRSRKNISVPTYVLGPNKKEHEKYFENLVDGILAPNIYYLGKHGLFTTSEGLNIGYISGIEGPFQGVECDMHTFNYESLEEFRESFVRSGKKMHILLTSPWPIDIQKNDLYNKNPIKECSDTKCISTLLSWMAINLTPSYHFCGMQGVYYERSPYKNENCEITKFIALADFYGHDDQKMRTTKTPKQKWLYGFTANKDLSSKDIPMVTQSPYSTTHEYCVQPISKQFFYDISAGNNAKRNKIKLTHNKKFKGEQTIKINPDGCWFCLSNKTAAKHMIISTSDQIYLAINKGPLIKENLLIATVGHYKSLIDIPEAADLEVKVLKTNLNLYFQSSGRGAIFFERNVKSAHFNLQVIPVPYKMVDRIEQAFIAKFKEYGLKLVLVPDNALLHQIVWSVGYFYLELPNGKCYLYNINKENRMEFPLHIAREVLASKSLLDVEDRIDWKKCQQTDEEAEKDVVAFRKAFKPFNRWKGEEEDE